jgi:hypothetical protein
VVIPFATPPRHPRLANWSVCAPKMHGSVPARCARHRLPTVVGRARSPQQSEASRLSTDEKVALFRRLFQGRTDVYPVRWQSKAGKSGYSPACANEWRPGICEKPRIKCSDCGHRLLIPLSDQIIYDHLAGRNTQRNGGTKPRTCSLHWPDRTAYNLEPLSKKSRRLQDAATSNHRSTKYLPCTDYAFIGLKEGVQPAAHLEPQRVSARHPSPHYFVSTSEAAA